MAVRGGGGESQATQLQLLVLHQLYKPYVSGQTKHDTVVTS